MNARRNAAVARSGRLERRAACPSAHPCYRPRTLKRPRGRGGIGRRARFRSWYRKMWGFESLRPHHPSPGYRTAQHSLRMGLKTVIMKTVELEHEGLKRAYTLTIAAKDIDARVDQEVKRLAPTVRMPGFRPGKVPPNLIRKMHGDALQRDALSGAVQDGVQQLLSEKKLRPAMQPEVELDQGLCARQGRRGPGSPRSAARRAQAQDRRLEARAADGRGRRCRVGRAIAAAGQLAEELEGRAQGPQGGDRRHRRDRFRRHGRRRRVRRRHRRGHVGRTGLGQPDPRASRTGWSASRPATSATSR